MAPEVSVVIAVRNAERDLPVQLAALAGEQWGDRLEVIVADNGSTDGTRQVSRRFASQLPKLRIVDAADRVGPADTRNMGAVCATAEFVLFLDADDEIKPGYLHAMAEALRKTPLVAARHDSISLNPVWLRHSRPAAAIDSLLAPFGFLPAAGAGGLGVRQSTFLALGGFDPALATGEDVDFCWRAQFAGQHLALVPNATVRVRFRSGIREVFSQAIGYGESGPALYRRHRSHGMPRRSWRSAIRYWLGPLRRLRGARSREGRTQLVFLLGLRIGILRGCIRSRVLYL